mgnify:CR=1 FL=1
MCFTCHLHSYVQQLALGTGLLYACEYHGLYRHVHSAIEIRVFHMALTGLCYKCTEFVKACYVLCRITGLL